jgi:hypothetical protein
MGREEGCFSQVHRQVRAARRRHVRYPNSTPSTLHPDPYTLISSPSTLHPQPYTLNPTPSTLHTQPHTLIPKPCTLILTPTPYRSRVWRGHEREFFIDNLLIRIYLTIVILRWTGLAPWEFELPTLIPTP